MPPKSPKKQPAKKTIPKKTNTPAQNYWFYCEEKVYKTIDGVHTILDDDTGEILGTLSDEKIQKAYEKYLQKKYTGGGFLFEIDNKEYKTNDIGEHIVTDMTTGKMLEKISDIEMYQAYDRYLLQIDEYEDWEYDGKIYTTKDGIHTVTDAETGEDL